MVVLDVTKNGRGGSWVLDSGTAEALRRWKSLCPSKRLVFPASAVPRHRRNETDRLLCAGHLAEQLRDGLRQAEVIVAILRLDEHGGDPSPVVHDPEPSVADVSNVRRIVCKQNARPSVSRRNGRFLQRSRICAREGTRTPTPCGGGT